MESVTEFAYAKVNLSLEVCGRRKDGYHEICSVMQSLHLHDTVHIRPRDTGFSIRVVQSENPDGALVFGSVVPSGLEFVPQDNRNLAWRAAELMARVSGIRFGVDIIIEKAIPVAAGLAGGSADAAAVLRGINRLYDLGFSLKDLMEIGSEIGADIPFCVLQGTALVEGIGERVKPIRGMALDILLAKPGFGVSTALAYQEYDKFGIFTGGRSELVVQSLCRGDFDTLCRSLVNDLQDATFRLRSELKAVEAGLLRAGCRAVLMSGSGPTMFGLVDSYEHGLKAAEGLCRNVEEVILTKAYLRRSEGEEEQEGD